MPGANGESVKLGKWENAALRPLNRSNHLNQLINNKQRQVFFETKIFKALNQSYRKITIKDKY